MRLPLLLGKPTLACATFTLLLCAAAQPSEGADPVFDARGFQPNRELLSELPFEHIDPMTGNLLLTFTDLVLPGNAGFDLRIQRTYNSKIYATYSNLGGFTLDEDTWAGIGWTLHMGRVLNPFSVNPGPIVEMPDGSRHQMYLHWDGNVDHYITKDYWTFDKATATLRLPNGVRYTFARAFAGFLWVTEIADPFGNKIVVSYAAQPAPADAIASISQQLVGGQTRTLTFTFNPTLPDSQGQSVAAGSLATMTYNGHTWTYTQQLSNPFIFKYTQLLEVQPPLGPPWTFGYDMTNSMTTFMLNHLETANGGKIDYTYVPQVFYMGSGVIYSPALETRQISGQNVPSGTWSYAYTSTVEQSRTVVTSPCSKTTYNFLGFGIGSNLDPWKIGAMASRATSSLSNTVFETEVFTWTRSVPISDVAESGSSLDTHVALLGRSDLTRSGRTYSTTYIYSPLGYDPLRADNFNDFGRANSISETGDLSRTTSRTFFYGSPTDPSFGTYIVDKTEAETVQVGTESFTKSSTYMPSNGFKTSETIYGVATTFSPHSSGSGNVGKVTDANGNETSYSYSWGVPSQIQTPEHTITRIINNDSTIASETRRGFTTTFSYDALTRPTQTRPPVGNVINTTYDNDGEFVEVTRDPSSLRTNLDGFERPVGTENAVGIKTTLTYDACGRTTFESYPFVGGTPTGTTYQYDPIGRITRRTHPDNSFVSYAYSQGNDVTITDEDLRVTKQNWSAFGDPGAARLASITDANNILTPYTYNALGNLKSVTLPGGGASRSWSYNAKNQVTAETHPESGLTSYTYYPNGNLETRTDAQFGTTTFTYDGNNRVIGIDRPGSSYDTSITYDDSDNRTSLETAEVSTVFAYDGANRLTSRTDDIDGVVLKSTYKYDGNDNIFQITYPSGTIVEYQYDDENRITHVGPTSGAAYADQFGYHPSGALSAYRTGNGLLHQFTYDNRHRLKNLDAGGASRLRLVYDYYKTSNVKGIQDSRGAQFSPGFQYDNLDRLRQVTTAYGTPTFTYDDKGNRLTKKIGTQTTTYTYNTPSQLLISATGAEPDGFTYDLNGNLIANTAGTYVYAPTNMMVLANIDSSVTNYMYDGDDLRKAKITGSGTSFFAHGLGGQLLGEYAQTAGTLTIAREYVFAGTRLIADLTPTALSANPSSLAFIAVLDEGNPNPQNVTISASAGNVSWTATDDATWLSVFPTFGVTPATLTVSVNASGLQPRSYSASVTITAPGAGSSVVVPVELTVFATASLYLSPTTASFYQAAGGPNPAPSTINVLYTSGAAVAWQATTTDAWISISPSSGTTPDTFEVSVSGEGLSPGTHRGTVIVDSPTNPGPQTLNVELTISPGPGTACALDASYCEIFDDEPLGDLDAGWIWSEPNVPQVVPDPRGTGNVMLLDPPAVARLNGDVNLASAQAISGTEISVQLMTTGTNPNDPQSLAKIEFYTEPGKAWGKTTRTFGTLRFGANLRFQYGPNNYQMLVQPMQPGRWYAVTVRYVNGQANVYVDGDLKFTTAAPDASLQMEAFSLTAWDFAPGAAYADLLEVRPPQLLIEPMKISLEDSPACDPGLTQRQPGARPSNTLSAPPPPAPASGLSQTSQKHLPVAFEPNVGQAASSAKFVARAAGHLLLARAHDIILAVPERPEPQSMSQRSLPSRFAKRHGREAGQRRLSLVKMKIGRSDREMAFKPDGVLPGVSHYFTGPDQRSWRRNVRHYSRLVAREIYPGIDLVLRDAAGRIEYDLVVAPGADPSQIQIEYEGAQSVSIDDTGDLVIVASLGQELRQPRPRVYQQDGGGHSLVLGSYLKRSDGSVGFALGEYDRTKGLVIDPVLAWSTQFGGSDLDEPHEIAVDSVGNIYVAGPTYSADFPVVEPFQETLIGISDAFLVQLSPNGGNLIYSSYLGGVGEDWAHSVTVDPNGNPILAGLTHGGTGFPQYPPSSEPFGPGGLYDAFVTKFSSDGSQLLFSTTLGGSYLDLAHQVVSDNAGRVYLTGITLSGDFPLQSPIQPALSGEEDSFIAALSSDGQQLSYSTYYGGNEVADDFPTGLTVTPSGEAFVVGVTTATDFPGASACESTGDAFVIRLSSSGTLLSALCHGGAGADWANQIAVRPGAGIVVVGGTESRDFPQVGALASYAGGLYDGFIAEFSLDLSQVLFSTPFGGSDADDAADVVSSRAGETYVLIPTASNDIPVVSPASCGAYGLGNLFVLKLDTNRQLAYATYLPTEQGVGGADSSGTMALSAQGVLLAADASEDAFVAELLDTVLPENIKLTPLATNVCEGVPVEMRAERQGGAPGTLFIDYEPINGTAVTPFDFDGTPGTVTLGDMVCAATISVPTYVDGLQEPHETLSVEITGPGGGTATLGAIILGNGTSTGQFAVSQRDQPTGPTWQATVDVQWLVLDNYSGFGPSTVTVTANPAGLPNGTYLGRITVTADVTGSPQVVVVTMTLSNLLLP